MRNVRTKVFKFSELDEKAKQKAINQHRDVIAECDFWEGENQDCLKEFCKVFPAKITRDGLRYAGECELTGVRLATHIWNNYRSQIYKPKYYSICNGHKNCVGINSKHRYSKIQLDEHGCPLTGFYLDNEILSPIFDFMRKPDNSDFSDLINQCYSAWEKAIEADREFQLSDEMVIEGIEANEYEFLKDGSLYHNKN